MADQSIKLTAYDPTWQARFAEQQVRLDTILKPWLAGEIEHIGSTSVAGLRSKPIVDILVPVRSSQPLAQQFPSWKRMGGCFGRTIPTKTIVSGSFDQAPKRAHITYRLSNMIIRIFEH